MSTKKSSRKPLRQPDRSKRIAYGCTIDAKNIIEGPRKRKDFDYNIHHVEFDARQGDEVGLVGSFPLRKGKEARPSVNTLEKREQIEKENFSKMVKKFGKMKLKKTTTKRKPKKEEEKKKKEESEDEVEEETEEKQEEKKEEKKSETKVRSRGRKKSETKSEEKPKLSEAVLSEIERLGGKLKEKKPRKYKDFEIPATIQAFCDVQWTEKNNLVSDKYNAAAVFGNEFIIEEWDEYKFLKDHDDAILIGEGDVVIAARMKDSKQDLSDFNIYVLDDQEKDKFEGPYKLSAFLKSCEANLPDEEEEEADE